MNKYQEALNYLDFYCSVRHTEQQDLLQELVDKEVPMKPIPVLNTHGYANWYKCSKCLSEPIFKGDRCMNNECGQKISWEVKDD